MSTLSPSDLETADYGTQGWNGIYTNNWQLLNEKLGHLMSGLYATGIVEVDDPDATTAEELTDSTGGTASNTLVDVGSSFDQATLNNNFASVTDEVNKLRADNIVLRNCIIELLVALRKTTGIGLLADS